MKKNTATKAMSTSNQTGPKSPRAEVVRLIGNRFYEAHPFRAGAAGREELSQARPLFEQLADDDLARFAFPLLELLLERLEPCASCHACLGDIGADLLKKRPRLVSQWANRVAARPPDKGTLNVGHCPADSGLLGMSEYTRGKPIERIRVEYQAMAVDGLGWHIVAKVLRLSSPPLALGLVDNPRAIALRRLADILCCGRWSRNYADFVCCKQNLKQDPEPEWRDYEQAVGQELGIDVLQEFKPLPLAVPTAPPAMRVSFHNAEMNSRPYCVARVGAVLGAPTAVYLAPPEDKERNALDRLADIFRIGPQGRCFADFAATLRAAGHSDDAIRHDWNNCAAVVSWEIAARDTRN